MESKQTMHHPVILFINKYPQNTNSLFKLKPFRTMSEIEINKLALSQLYKKKYIYVV